MGQILLTDEENPYSVDNVKSDECLHSEIELHNAFNGGAKAQLKKVVEWGNAICEEEEHKGNHSTRMERRHTCPACWQALLKEVE